MHKFDYRWTLADAHFTKDKGTVFSCFACGGGSSMGYKLAGFDVIGCNEIDHRMMFTYCKNHNPRFPFLEPIQTFKDKQDLPPELFNLDILDGSPPCSTFSMAGSREEAWGKMKKFREGQAEQVLDTLFFDFIQLAKRLQPKVVVAENVKGLLLGSAKEYMTNIYRGFDDAGYYVNHYLLDAQTMGVPQRRQRVFFVCLRKDLVGFVPCEQTLFETLPRLNMNFNEAVGGGMVFNCIDWGRDTKTPKVHPTQKPVPLLQYLIRIFTDPGDVVIDPCAGSGSTLFAAKELGRRAYGFEIKKDFFKAAQEKALSRPIQASLF